MNLKSVFLLINVTGGSTHVYIINKEMVLLTSAPGTLFNQSKIRNYSIGKLNISISNALITQISIKTCYLKPLKSFTGHSLTFSINKIQRTTTLLISLFFLFQK